MTKIQTFYGEVKVITNIVDWMSIVMHQHDNLNFL